MHRTETTIMSNNKYGRIGSPAHEDMVDDWRFCWSEFTILHPEYGFPAAGIYAEHLIFSCFHPELKRSKDGNVEADGYISTPDGCGPIAVEVGNMKDGKWSHVTFTDGLPLRVLRIGFDGSVWMLNERNTKFEIAYLGFLRKKLRNNDTAQRFLSGKYGEGEWA